MPDEIKNALKQLSENATLTTPEISKRLLEYAIHCELNGIWGNTLEPNFYNALNDLKGKLLGSPVAFSDTDLRRIIGQETYWNSEVSNNAFSCGADLEKARHNFLAQCVGDIDALQDEGSIGSCLNELDMFLESWAHVLPFGFGIPKLDEAIGGISPGNVCVLTGAPGTMKTSLALSMVNEFISHARDAKDKVYYCSVDMEPSAITMRLIERDCGIPEGRVKWLREANRDEYMNYVNTVRKKYPSLIIRGDNPSNPMNIDRLLSECLGIQPKLVVIDYFTKLKAIGQSDLEFVEVAMRRVLNFAHQYRITFLILSQMSRSSRSDQGSGRVGGHGKGGGIVEELADVEIELIKHPSEEENAPDLIIAALTKSRHGQSNKFFSLDYQGAIKRFTGKATKMRRNSNKKAAFVSGGGGFYDNMLNK